MTTDMKSMTVGESLAAQIRRVLGRFDDEAQPVVLLVREVARRLEEAQRKIVAQQALMKNIKDELSFITGVPFGSREARAYKLLADYLDDIDDTHHILAAHDAELTAEAKAEALEEAVRLIPTVNFRELSVWLNDKAAEYRAKAGRKE